MKQLAYVAGCWLLVACYFLVYRVIGHLVKNYSIIKQ